MLVSQPGVTLLLDTFICGAQVADGVIQEALAIGKPVLCSRIGGMAEKVEDGVTGAYFEAGSASDLAMKLMGLGTRTLHGQSPAMATAETALASVIEHYAP